MTNTSRVLILGLPKSGKKTLLQGISRYLEFDHTKTPEQVIKTTDCEFNCYTADVFTKYYKAPIELCFAPGDNSVISKDSIHQVVDSDCQGVIFVCRSFDSQSLDAIKRWNDILKEKNMSFDIQLVVFSYNDVQSDITRKNAEMIKDWCIDNLYEFIPSNLRIPSHTWKETEKEGVARVIENLECVMWKYMDQQNRRTTERVIEESIIMNDTELEQCSYCHKSRSIDHINLYRCGRCRMISYCSKECQVKDWKNHKGFCNQIVGCDPAAKAKEEDEKRLKEAEKSISLSLPPARNEYEDESPIAQSEEEAATERFAQLMMECRKTKEMAKDLPDDERKKRAAAVTAKIMRELQMGTEEEIQQIESDLKDMKV